MGSEHGKPSKSPSTKKPSQTTKDFNEQLFKKYTSLSGRNILCKGDFKDIFSLPGDETDDDDDDALHLLLYRKFSHRNLPPQPLPQSQVDGVSERDFMEESKHIQALLSEVEYFVTLFTRPDEGQITRNGARKMLEVSLQCVYIINGLSIDSNDDDSNKLISSVTTALMRDDSSSRSIQEVVYYINANIPKLLAPIHMFVTDRLNGKQTPSLSSERLPFSSLLSPPVLWLLSSALPTLYTPCGPSSPSSPGDTSTNLKPAALRHMSRWHKLYDADRDGFSLNRLEHHVFSYRSPTVMLVGVGPVGPAAGGTSQVYCAACDVEWREHPKQWGGHHSHIYRILPEFSELEHGSNLFYYNSKDRQLTRGLQLGSDPRSPLVYIDTSMDTVTGKCITLCAAAASDTSTASSAPPAAPAQATLTAIEVWGCGDEEAREEQGRQKQWERSEAEKASKVKNPGSWDENPDKFILDIGGVKVEHNERADTCEVYGHEPEAD